MRISNPTFVVCEATRFMYLGYWRVDAQKVHKIDNLKKMNGSSVLYFVLCRIRTKSRARTMALFTNQFVVGRPEEGQGMVATIITFSPHFLFCLNM